MAVDDTSAIFGAKKFKCVSVSQFRPLKVMFEEEEEKEEERRNKGEHLHKTMVNRGSSFLLRLQKDG